MSIIIETSKIKVCECLYELCDYCGYESEFTDRLWENVILNNDLYEELVYYLYNKTFKDKICVSGYSLSDLYVFQMDKYNLVREIGKNPVECSKDRMVLNAFMMMSNMIKDPERYVQKLTEGRGEDRL